MYRGDLTAFQETLPCLQCGLGLGPASHYRTECFEQQKAASYIASLCSGRVYFKMVIKMNEHQAKHHFFYSRLAQSDSIGSRLGHTLARQHLAVIEGTMMIHI